MRCPPELRLSIYADGELEAAERRSLEAHLIGCEGCRARVVALREETELLGDALWEREPKSARLPSRPAPARGLALGAAPALAASVLIAGVGGWLVEARWAPASIGWINPFGLQGVSDMAFDFVFLLRDEAPGLLALVVAGAATLGVSLVLSFALAALARRWAGPGAMALLLLLLCAPTPSQAHFGMHRHEDYVLAAGETHDGTLILSGRRVNIDGRVDGDLIVMTERLTVRGEVRGNVLALARSAELSGAVQGSAWCLCRDARIAGELDSDLYALANEVRVAHTARVARNVTAAAQDVVIEGAVGRDLVAAAEAVELRGSVERDVHTWHARLALRHAARVGRDVTAVVEKETDLEVETSAVVAGETRTERVPRFRDRPFDRFRQPAFYLFHAITLAAAFVVGMLLHGFAPAVLGTPLDSGTEFFRTLGLGFLAAIAAPIALGLAALTLIGVPIALMGLAAFLAALYASSILVAAWLGRTLVPHHEGRSGFALALLAGLLALVVVGHLPFVGAPLRILVALTGLGLIVRQLRQALATHRAAV